MWMRICSLFHWLASVGRFHSFIFIHSISRPAELSSFSVEHVLQYENKNFEEIPYKRSSERNNCESGLLAEGCRDRIEKNLHALAEWMWRCWTYCGWWCAVNETDDVVLAYMQRKEISCTEKRVLYIIIVCLCLFDLKIIYSDCGLIYLRLGGDVARGAGSGGKRKRFLIDKIPHALRILVLMSFMN